MAGPGKAPKLTVAEQQYLQLAEAESQARGRAELGALAAIRQAAAQGSWQAAAWYLERVHGYVSPKAGGPSEPGRMGVGGRPAGAESAPDRHAIEATAPPKVTRLSDRRDRGAGRRKP